MSKETVHGIALRSGSVEYTTLTKVKDEWQVLGQDSQPRDSSGIVGVGEDGEESDAHSLLVAELRPMANEWRGEASLALPADQLLLRVVDLPTIDPDELLSMVELQIETFSPFPVDTLTVSFEVLAETESSSRVLIVAVKNDVVDALGEAFHEVGVTVRWVDVDVLGWWHWLTQKEKVSKYGREALLMNLQDGLVLIVAQNGVPLTVRAIPGLEDMNTEEFSETVAEEVDFTLTSLETEWGGVDHTQISLWSEGDPPIGLAESLGVALSTSVASGNLNDLPLLSHALADRATERDPGTVDLAPPEWEAGDLARLTKRNLLVASGGVVGVCLCVLLGVSVMAGVRKAGLEKVKLRRQQIIEPAQELRLVRDKVNDLRRYIDDDSSSLEVLRAVSLSLPEGVDISQFYFSRTGNTAIRCEAAQKQSIFKFSEKLGETGLFEDVESGRVEPRRRKGVVKFQTRIEVKLKEVSL